MCIKKFRHEEIGLVFKNGKLTRVLREGIHFFANILKNEALVKINLRDAMIEGDSFDMIYESPLMDEYVDRYDIKDKERALVFKNGKLDRILAEGKYLFLKPYSEEEVEVINLRNVNFHHRRFDAIFDSELIDHYAERVELKDNERALVWVNNRYSGGFSGGKHLFMNVCDDVKIEKVTTDPVQFRHGQEVAILKHSSSVELFETYRVSEDSVAVWYHNGKRQELLTPGKYAFWQGAGSVKIHKVDMREKVIDIQGQDIMSADRVTLRLNAVVTYRVIDPTKYVESIEDASQAIYRETQLAIREMVGREELDALLISKETLSSEIFQRLVARAAKFGVQVNGVGIRDIILPGEMKVLLNKVVEAKKAAEANLITRREENAALRSQANSAKMIENNPTLMRLRELEILESIAEKTQLQVLIGGGEGLREQVMKLI